MATEWTKEQYLEWLRTRGEPGTWGLEACSAADRLIKREALDTLKKRLNAFVASKPIREFVELCASAHFGAVEVDQLCMALDCYPEWMEK